MAYLALPPANISIHTLVVLACIGSCIVWEGKVDAAPWKIDRAHGCVIRHLRKAFRIRARVWQYWPGFRRKRTRLMRRYWRHMRAVTRCKRQRLRLWRRLVRKRRSIRQKKIARQRAQASKRYRRGPRRTRWCPKLPVRLAWPLRRGHIGSGFGPRLGPISRKWGFHSGVDISAPQKTVVFAAASGKVIAARWTKSCGYGVFIRHKAHPRVVTGYCHLFRMLVRKGDWVLRDERIGLVGSTGYSTSPHLHFSVRRGRILLNPACYLPQRAQLSN